MTDVKSSAKDVVEVLKNDWKTKKKFSGRGFSLQTYRLKKFKLTISDENEVQNSLPAVS